VAFGNRREGRELFAGDLVIGRLGGAMRAASTWIAISSISIALGATRSAATRRISPWMRR
jgi:hypothetical protein